MEGDNPPEVANLKNGRMTKQEIVDTLRELKLNHIGNKKTVSKRLRDFYKRQRLAAKTLAAGNKTRSFDKFYDYICVLDFECTCCLVNPSEFPHEIIEFPVVLIKVSTLEIVDTFHAYCKPQIFPRLTKFCQDLTGISQDQVNTASPFPDVFTAFNTWLHDHSLGTKWRYALATDGPWDFARFFQLQCQHLSIPIPHHCRHWINVRKHFANFFLRSDGNQTPRHLSLASMLTTLGLTFDGRPHSGIDDARNIARIVIALFEAGCELRVNERLIRRDKFVVRESKQAADTAQTSAERVNVPPSDEVELEILSKSHSDRSAARSWKDALPYKLVGVTRAEFLKDVYLECLTCSESEGADEDDEQGD